MEPLTILATAAISLIPSTVIAFVVKNNTDHNKKIEDMKRKEESMQLGIQAILRDRLYQMYDHYLEKGFAPIYAKENFMNMYEQYHNLGKNGVMDDYKEKFMDFPDRPDKTED